MVFLSVFGPIRNCHRKILKLRQIITIYNTANKIPDYMYVRFFYTAPKVWERSPDLGIREFSLKSNDISTIPNQLENFNENEYI